MGIYKELEPALLDSAARQRLLQGFDAALAKAV